MHRRALMLTFCLAVGCSDASTGEVTYSREPDAGNTAFPPPLSDAQPRNLDAGGANDDAGAGEGEPSVNLGSPVFLQANAVGIVGVTADDHVIYRASDGLRAASVAVPGQGELISPTAGTVLIRGDVVFQWTELDWTTRQGELTIWTSSHGRRSIGTAYYAEDSIGASPDGTHVLYVRPAGSGVADLYVATADLQDSWVLVERMGRGDADTCRASFGFVLNDVVVASCELGKMNATLRRFQVPFLESDVTTIATGVRSLWSADATGGRLFFVDSASQGIFWESGDSIKIDDSVTWGMLMPAGDTVLYTVSDQLRSTPVPETDPVPVVVNGFRVRTDLSPDYRHILFSKEVVYGGGTRRDLYLASTDAVSARPIELVGEPVAVLSKSSFTSDAQWVLYLSGVGSSGAGQLVAHSVSADEQKTVDGVDTLVAARKDVVVFSDGRSDPSVYPITADLKVIDVGSGETQLVKKGITDGRNFFLTADRGSVVYIMPASADPGGDPQGLYVQPLF